MYSSSRLPISSYLRWPCIILALVPPARFHVEDIDKQEEREHESGYDHSSNQSDSGFHGFSSHSTISPQSSLGQRKPSNPPMQSHSISFLSIQNLRPHFGHFKRYRSPNLPSSVQISFNSARSTKRLNALIPARFRTNICTPQESHTT